VCYAHPDHSGRDCEAPLLLRGAPARPIRFDDETIAKGYRRDQFEASGPVTCRFKRLQSYKRVAMRVCGQLETVMGRTL
jgi:hypothetical protein